MDALDSFLWWGAVGVVLQRHIHRGCTVNFRGVLQSEFSQPYTDVRDNEYAPLLAMLVNKHTRDLEEIRRELKQEKDSKSS